MTDIERDKLEEEVVKWKMRTSIAMGLLRKMSRMMPEDTEYGDLVRKAIKDIEDLT